MARQILFDEELQGREDIYLVWQLGELGDIVIHDYPHAYVDQLAVSLFSLPSDATEPEKIKLDVKKAFYGVMMMEKVIKRDGMANNVPMIRALRSAYFDYACANLGAKNMQLTIAYGLRSARLGVQVRHVKLLARTLLASVQKLAAPNG